MQRYLLDAPEALVEALLQPQLETLLRRGVQHTWVGVGVRG